MNAQGYLGFFITILIFDTVLFISRFYLLRNQDRQVYNKCADGFYLVAGAINFVMICFLIHQSVEELKSINLRNGDESLVAEDMYSQDWNKFTWILNSFYIIVLWCLKAAWLSFYWGLFYRTQTQLRYLLHFCIIVVTLTGVALIIFYFSLCTPMENNWATGYEANGRCRFTLIFQSSVNIGTDVLVLFLPLLVVNRLLLGPSVKVVLSIAFLLGGVSISASTIRHIIINETIEEGSTPEENYRRRRWVELWSTIEVSAALFSFCLPIYRKHVMQTANRHKNPKQGSAAWKNRTVADSIDRSAGMGMVKRARDNNFLNTNVSLSQYLDTVEWKDVLTSMELRQGQWSSLEDDFTPPLFGSSGSSREIIDENGSLSMVRKEPWRP